MKISILFLTLILGKGFSTLVDKSSKDSETGKDHPVQNTSELIVFSARLSSDLTISEGATIVFDDVLTNVGDLYFPTSGQFACPDGLYVFIWNIMKDSGSDVGMQCITQLRKGGTDQKYGPKTSYGDTSYSGATEMMAVLECTTSPPTSVTVMAESWSDTIPTSMYRAGRTTFSGFRLPSNIAFTVELSADTYIIEGGRVFFDKTLNNFGGYYDDTNGRFRCPDEGIYVFSVSICTKDPSTPWAVSRLMKEKEVVVEGPITYIATSSYDSGSSSITSVVQCSTGHSIYVEAKAAHDFPYNSYTATLTAFTGFKLYDAAAGYAAFSAVMTTNHSTTYDGEPFVFDKVITNIGDAFNPSLNVFICPDDGFYHFTWSVTANYGGEQNSQVELYMDDTYVAHTYLTPQASDDESGTSGTSTMTTIKQCSLGSLVQIRGRATHERVFLGGYTMFSGYRIPGDSVTM